MLHIGTDIQPYALIVATIIYCRSVLINGIAVDRKCLFKYFLVLLSVTVFMLSSLSSGSVFQFLRSCLGYISLSVIPLSINALSKQQKRKVIIKEEWIKMFINIWGITGLVQKFLRPNFMFFFIANARTSHNRGVLGWASEPSFYGYMCVFFIFFALLFHTQRRVYIIWSILQLVFLAQSSVGVVYLVVIGACLVLYKLRKFNIKIIFGIMFAAVCVYYISFWFACRNQHTRLGNLMFYAFRHSPSEILSFAEQDESIAARINNIKICIIGVVSNLGMPHGFASYKGRLESGYGAALYELGIIGVVMMYNIWKSVYKGYIRQYAWVIATSLSIIMFSAVQLSFPLLGFFVGICEWQEDQNKNYLFKGR